MSELANRLMAVREILRRESAPWGREPRLIAVTKTASAEDILPLAALGVCDIGENRVQAIREKLPVLGENFRVHMIGRLQSNKVKYIMNNVCLIHSADNLPLIAEIDRQAAKSGVTMPVLVQVNIAREIQKGGIAPEDTLAFLRKASQYPRVRVSGLMAMMPLGAPRDELFTFFRGMRQLFDECAAEAIPNTDMRELSMGMSQDFDLAARAGATMVRVGSALFSK